MKKELELKIVKQFPLLYKSYGGDPRNTCLAFGMECDKGWYQIIYDLSAKLETYIRNFHAQYPDISCTCGCAKTKHYYGTGKCTKVYRCNYPKHVNTFGGCYVPNWKNSKRYKNPVLHFVKTWFKYKKYILASRIRRYQYIAGRYLLDKFNIGYDLPCSCKEYEPNLPRASQVKEKYGTLSFYMSSATDEMYEMIREAEQLSEVTCEYCGNPGTLRTGGWWKTLCDKCNSEEK